MHHTTLKSPFPDPSPKIYFSAQLSPNYITIKKCPTLLKKKPFPTPSPKIFISAQPHLPLLP